MVRLFPRGDVMLGQALPNPCPPNIHAWAVVQSCGAR